MKGTPIHTWDNDDDDDDDDDDNDDDDDDDNNNNNNRKCKGVNRIQLTHSRVWWQVCE